MTVGLTEGLRPPYLLLLVSGRPHPAGSRPRGGALHPARHHHRRCLGRGLRQDRQAAGPRLSRRPRGRAGGALGPTGALPSAPADAGAGRAAFLLRRPQDGGAPSRRGVARRWPRATSPTCARTSSRRWPTASPTACGAPSRLRRHKRGRSGIWSPPAAWRPTQLFARGSRPWSQRGRLQPPRAAGGAVHRQRRDGGLGGCGASREGPRRRPATSPRGRAGRSTRCRAGAGRRAGRAPRRDAGGGERPAPTALLGCRARCPC